MDDAARQEFISAHDLPVPVSIRLNPLKWSGRPALEPVPWYWDAFYLEQRPTFTFDPRFHAGAYYVQEAGSMFLEQAVRATGLAGSGCVALDLCAAPGGKSTHLLSLLGRDALLVSNEVVRPRARILCDNITKWGHANVCVTGSDPALFDGLPEFFDLVVVDAPCSGEGLFRKDADAMQHWSEEAVAHCAVRQLDILGHAWNALRPGGYLVYSTCTYNRKENEENVARVLEWGGSCIPIPVEEQWGITTVQEHGVVAYRFMPHRTRAEGFFLSLIRKNGDAGGFRPAAPRGFWKSLPQKETEDWMPSGQEGLRLIKMDDRVVAIPPLMEELFPAISRSVYPLQFGTEVARSVKGQVVPSHAWAASAHLDADAFPCMEVGLSEAVQYLRGNPIPAQGAKGFGLVSYEGLSLGLAKGAGNRWNNLYPDQLRIRDMRTLLSEVTLPPLDAQA